MYSAINVGEIKSFSEHLLPWLTFITLTGARFAAYWSLWLSW